MEDYRILVLANGLEVIGRVRARTDHTMTLEHPCVLPDIEQLIMLGDFVVYSKNNIINFNRDIVIADYEPREDVLELYEKFINAPAYGIAWKLIESAIRKEIKAIDDIDSEVVDKLKDILDNPERLNEQKKPDFGNGPKVLTLEDVLEHTKGESKKKLN